MDGRLPSFIIVGAAKAATTWIAHQLRECPDVFLPGPEPHYFSREFHRGPEWYASLFADAGKTQLVGEKSADYLADANVPGRIAQMLPDVRLIAQLRNPVERAYSDYCMLARRGQVSRDIRTYLDPERTPERRFLDDGLYARHIGRFLDHFPIERLKIILHEDIRREPERVLADVWDFIGLRSAPNVSAVGARVNDSSAPLLPLPLRRLPRSIKSVAAPLRGSPAFKRLRNLLARPFPYPPLDSDVRRRLEDFYRDDVAELGKLIGRDIAAWTEPADMAA